MIMGYIRAEDVLPEEILALVQRYVDGQSIYIPRKEECHKAWGTRTETKNELMIRNRQIYEAFKSGATIIELSAKFFLTEKSVRRIIRNYQISPPDKFENRKFQEELKIE